MSQGAKGENLRSSYEVVAKYIKDYSQSVRAEIKEKESTQAEDVAKLVKEVDDINLSIADIQANVMKPLMKFLKLGSGAFKDVASGTPVESFSAILKSAAEGVEELVNFKNDLDKQDAKRQVLELQLKDKKSKIDAIENTQGKVADATLIPEFLRSVYTDVQEHGPRVGDFLDVRAEVPKDLDTLIELLNAIPNGVTLDDMSNAAVQAYHERYKFLTSIHKVNRRVLDTYAKGN